MAWALGNLTAIIRPHGGCPPRQDLGWTFGCFRVKALGDTSSTSWWLPGEMLQENVDQLNHDTNPLKDDGWLVIVILEVYKGLWI